MLETSKEMTQSDEHKFRHILGRMRRYLVTGLLILLPLVVTLAVVKVSVDFVNRTVGAWLPRLMRVQPGMRSYRYFQITGYVAVLVFVMATGMIASRAVGRKVINTVEQIMSRLPLVSRIYLAVRQIRDAFVQRKGTVFLYPVLVEYPREGIYVIGFVTAEKCDAVISPDFMGVFIPTTPNPTSGYLVFIPKEQGVRIHMNIEDAMKLIISGAAYMPETVSPGPPTDKVLQQSPS